MKNIKNPLTHPDAVNWHTLQIIMGGTDAATVDTTVLHGRWDGNYSDGAMPGSWA